MRKVFINFSNHPSSAWQPEQIQAAEKIGEIVDVRFPAVNPKMSDEDIVVLADEMIEKIIAYHPVAVMAMGEFTLNYRVVSGLLAKGVRVVSTTSERETTEEVCEDGSIRKVANFRFVAFRDYKLD